MLYYLTAIGLIAHTCFWGFGLALLALPRIWRRWAWAFVPGFGIALQSAVVWAAVHSPLAGTKVYAWWSELLPAALLVVAWSSGRVRLSWKIGGLVAIAFVAMWLLVSPMTKAGTGLTTSSLGSCDQADYAAGARVFYEFSRDDRSGFLGLPEVTKVGSADYFFDFWVRLNHFTPSALIAHHAAILGVEPFRLISVMAVAVVLLNLPVVLFFGRFTMGLRGAWLLAFMGLYALSPFKAYAVFHGQLGQLFATQGIALLTLGVFGASRFAHRGRSVWCFLPLLFVAVWILAGSYNFILPVCLAPGGAWLLAELLFRRNVRAVGRVLAVTASAFALCALLFWGRFDALIERFGLFHQYNFGWVVPLASPEGLLGLFRDSSLAAWPTVPRVCLSAAVVGLALAGLGALIRRRRPEALAAVALVFPVMAGWAILAWETRVRANASYDAYKLLSVFLPGLLAGMVFWLSAVRRCSARVRAGAVVACLLILGAEFAVGADFRRKMASPPLRVNRSLADLASLENDPRFASFNLVVEDYWSRLWANSFLLRRPQYFAIHTYEGRLNTRLKGEWDLSDSLLRAIPPNPADYVAFNARFFLVRAAAPGLVHLGFAGGWYPEESAASKRWRWSGGQGQLTFENPSGAAIEGRLKLRVQSYQERNLTLRLGEQVIATRHLDGSDQVIEIERVQLPAGTVVLTFAGEAGSPGFGDERRLAFALSDLEWRTVASEKP